MKNRGCLITLNVPHLRRKINKTCANRPLSCVNGEVRTEFGSLKEPAYRCMAALGRRACPLSRACARQLPQRGSPWQAGPLPTGRLRPDMAQKGGPCYRGQRLLDKRTLSSCRESWQRSTTVSDKIRLCSSRVGLTGTPVAPPLGELSPKVTERARMLEGRLLLFRAGHGILKKKKPPTRREKGETET